MVVSNPILLKRIKFKEVLKHKIVKFLGVACTLGI